ncbi:carboxypeptidase-like regulatory domain-containing protein [Imtechella halotolerans]|uniref:Outer membrane protein n=1 Tax=Imtechella halotolerans K1 TaxID=946077 RepID=I0W7H1_9FLAO|nr:carboxypeptidase-like regulatory domain-containing protein [Imtechella halotolerans]EID72337.1 hypothetical protein W5A_12556 [Imtechella halotolerans K1]WMQ64439.1 carboxypeptidase-like regulatory domain-containing protein [Imtechella halotolerans]
MKSFYTCLFLLLISISYSQDIILKGKILDENKSPLPGANVYFEGTTIGTITDVNGYFELKLVSDINSILVISYIGYEDIFINDHSVFLKEKIHGVYLQPKAETLQEVVVKSHYFSRKQFLTAFKENFIGKKKTWKECTIVNEDDLYFDYDYSNNTFIAKCDEPLIINNNHLGYQVIYKLEDFEVKFATKSLSSSQMFRSFYSGFSRFIDIDKNQKKIKRRQKAYENSTLQFFRWISKGDWTDKSYRLFDGSWMIDPDLYLKVALENNVYKISVTNIEKDFKPKRIVSELNILYQKRQQSKVIFQTNEFTIDKFGLNTQIEHIYFSGDMMKKKISELLPADYGM